MGWNNPWGILTGNEELRDLGIWGYTTEYSAIKEYYFDIDDTQYSTGYGHNAVGILWGGKVEWNTFFGKSQNISVEFSLFQ